VLTEVFQILGERWITRYHTFDTLYMRNQEERLTEAERQQADQEALMPEDQLALTVRPELSRDDPATLLSEMALPSVDNAVTGLTAMMSGFVHSHSTPAPSPAKAAASTYLRTQSAPSARPPPSLFPNFSLSAPSMPARIPQVPVFGRQTAPTQPGGQPASSASPGHPQGPGQLG
jgi:hypothetical protein